MKNKEKKVQKREKTKYDKVQFGFKIMSAVFVIIMLFGSAATMIFSLIYQ